MALINRADLPRDLPEGIPSKEVPFAPLKGEVRVRGMTLGEQLLHQDLSQAERQPRDGESVEQAAQRAGGDMAVRIAATCVVDEDGKPLLTLPQWQAFGASHGADVYLLAGEAMALSGAVPEAVEKN